MDISLFHYLDVVIGFAAVMLIGSSMVSVVTQWFLRWRNYRAQVLGLGLTQLIGQLDPRLAAHAEEIATAVLKHPLVAELGAGKEPRPGSVLRREDLVPILLDLASSGRLGKEVRLALATALGAGENDTPAEMLERIQMRAMELQLLFPSAASYLWHAEAVIEKAGGKFVAGVMARFDQTSERLTQLFTQRARTVTVVVALAAAILLPLDSIELLRRLSADGKLRASLAASAQQAVDKAKLPAASGDVRNDLAALRDLKSELDDPSMAIAPAGWWRGKVMKPGAAGEVDWGRVPSALAGVLLSGVLMSLGAPFWFDMLKNLLRLRPASAANEDKDRQDRATWQPAAGSPPLAGQIEPAQRSMRDPEAGVFGNAVVAAKAVDG